MWVFLSDTILEEKRNGLLKRKRGSTGGKNEERGQAKVIKDGGQTVGCSERDRTVCDTPTLTLESLLAKTPAREHRQRTG